MMFPMSPEREREIRNWLVFGGDMRQAIPIVTELLNEMTRFQNQTDRLNKLIVEQEKRIKSLEQKE